MRAAMNHSILPAHAQHKLARLSSTTHAKTTGRLPMRSDRPSYSPWNLKKKE